MQKNSIKREQSQAGLSFAERKNFRPQVKNKLLLLLALLLTAATGAWAQTNLSEVMAAYTAQNGETLTGTLGANVKISIADGATVTLDGVTINGANDEDYRWAGITCLGDATIILKGENTVKGFYEDYPGIRVPKNKTLTIQGTGSLDASSNGYGAGIGGGYEISCGNIVIEGGTIVATGGYLATGIGGGGDASCGDITIANTVTKVVATKDEQGTPHSIGSGADGSCGTVTIGGTVYADGIAESPYTYPTYAVTFADGVNPEPPADPEWTASPATGVTKGTEVTVTYSGSKKVLGVKAEKKAAAPVPITVTWYNDDITGTGNSFTKDGVTITAGDIDFNDKNFMSGGTFTTTLGNFTKIEVTTGFWNASGTGWSGSGQSGTWTGNASSVSFSNSIMGQGSGNTKFVFTIEPAN